MKETRVRFSSGGLVLEGILTIPEATEHLPAVIVCHPHPLYGGSLDNNVVSGVCGAVTQVGLISFRFNFRGVGSSQGEFGEGIGEQEDVEAAISFISTVEQVDSGRIGLAGYSAGAGFALPVGCKDARTKALAAVSPPLSMFDFGFLKSCPKPKLLISGSRDDLILAEQFLEFCRGLPEPKECESIERADHFWWGYETDLADKVTAFFTKVL